MAPPKDYKEVLGIEPQYPQIFNVLHLFHLGFLFLPWFFIHMPYAALTQHIIPFFTFYVIKSRTYNNVGRYMVPNMSVYFVRYALSRGTPCEGRATIFGRFTPYSMIYMLPSWRKRKSWLKYIKEPGVTGRWIADHNTERKDDDLVLFFTHGGGYVIDTGGTCQLFWLHLMEELTFKRGIKFSIFQLDYELAPDYQFPSQVIEMTAAYSYLVNTLGINPAKICIGGDSAGAQMVASILLHLAKPSREIAVPRSFGRLPPTPGASLLISPFIQLVSDKPSFKTNEHYDLIEGRCAALFALQYLGVAKVSSNFSLSWNPWHLIAYPHPTPKSYIDKELVPNMNKAERGQLPSVRARLANPYANPGGMDDVAWWQKAMPEHNMIVYGGKEVMYDDITEWVGFLEGAGIPITQLKKEYGVHDWLLYEPTIPWLRHNKSKGPDNAADWGVNNVADFLEAFSRGPKVQ